MLAVRYTAHRRQPILPVEEEVSEDDAAMWGSATGSTNQLSPLELNPAIQARSESDLAVQLILIVLVFAGSELFSFLPNFVCCPSKFFVLCALILSGLCPNFINYVS